MKKNKAPGKCPVCNEDFSITKLTCTTCGSELTGDFEGGRFYSLSDNDQYFIEVFVKCRGSIKEVEKELGVSYPTVRGKLDEVIKNLGYQIKESNEERDEKSSEILGRIESGELSPAKAAEMLKELKRSES